MRRCSTELERAEVRREEAVVDEVLTAIDEFILSQSAEELCEDSSRGQGMEAIPTPICICHTGHCDEASRTGELEGT